jgi:hypothetical protein
MLGPKFPVGKREDALQHQVARPRSRRRVLVLWALILGCVLFWTVVGYGLWTVL